MQRCEACGKFTWEIFVSITGIPFRACSERGVPGKSLERALAMCERPGEVQGILLMEGDER
jgi:hypothetical protein